MTTVLIWYNWDLSNTTTLLPNVLLLIIIINETYNLLRYHDYSISLFSALIYVTNTKELSLGCPTNLKRLCSWLQHCWMFADGIICDTFKQLLDPDQWCTLLGQYCSSDLFLVKGRKTRKIFILEVLLFVCWIK